MLYDMLISKYVFLYLFSMAQYFPLSSDRSGEFVFEIVLLNPIQGFLMQYNVLLFCAPGESVWVGSLCVCWGGGSISILHNV